MYCDNCGAKLVEGANFCEECGHKVLEELEKEKKPSDLADALISIPVGDKKWFREHGHHRHHHHHHHSSSNSSTNKTTVSR